MPETHQSKVDGPKIQKGKDNGKGLYDLKLRIWTVSGNKSRRCKWMKLDGFKKCKWTIQKQKLDGLKKWTVHLRFLSLLLFPETVQIHNFISYSVSLLTTFTRLDRPV